MPISVAEQGEAPGAATGRPALDITGLTFAWPGGWPAWAGWSARLAPGLTVVVGGDGAGKSTLLRLLATALKPTAGNLALCLPEPGAGATEAVAGVPRQVSRQLVAWPDPTAYRQHLFWCDPASDAHDALAASAYLDLHRQAQPAWNDTALVDLLAEMSLSEHLHKPMLGLSMGMRRKLRLAAALASGAALTLIDDPLAALDARSIRWVEGVLSDCATARRRLFVTTAYDWPDWAKGAAVFPLPQR
jgi:ABC-type multidrug transport system ATPase subunit